MKESNATSEIESTLKEGPKSTLPAHVLTCSYRTSLLAVTIVNNYTVTWLITMPRGIGTKIPRRDELGRLPEVNLLNRACAEELWNHLSAVLVSSRTPFHPTCRRTGNVSILLLFIPEKCSNRPYFQLYW